MPIAAKQRRIMSFFRNKNKKANDNFDENSSFDDISSNSSNETQG